MRAAAPMVVALVLAAGGCHKSHPAAAPAIEVQVVQDDLSRADIDSAVTAPIERSCQSVPNLTSLTGVSQDGRSLVTLERAPGTSLDTAFRDVQACLVRAQATLPRTAAAPTIAKRPGRIVSRTTWTSDVLPQIEVRAFVGSASADPLVQVAGVGRVAFCGGALEQLKVHVDPQALAATGFTLPDVVRTIQGVSRASTAMVLGFANGSAVRLGDVARIEDGGAPDPCRAYDERGPAPVIEELVYAAAGADPELARKAVEEQQRKAAREVPQAVELRSMTASRDLTVELEPAQDPAYDFAVVRRLRDAVGAVAGVGRFIVESGSPYDAPGTSGPAHVLLESSDEAMANAVVKSLSGLPFVRAAGEANATVTLQGADRAALKVAGEAIASQLAQRGELVARLGLADRPSLEAHIDEATAAKLGVSLDDARMILAATRTQGRTVGSYARESRTIPIVVHVAAPPGTTVFVRSAVGPPVPLSALVTWSSTVSPATLLRQGQFPMVGARVHTSDAAALQRQLKVPPDVHLGVVSD